jgi:hypothetical protein
MRNMVDRQPPTANHQPFSVPIPGIIPTKLARKLVYTIAILSTLKSLIVNLKLKTMKKILALALLLSLLYSCSRSVTPYEAASNHYNHCRNMK